MVIKLFYGLTLVKYVGDTSAALGVCFYQLLFADESVFETPFKIPLIIENLGNVVQGHPRGSTFSDPGPSGIVHGQGHHRVFPLIQTVAKVGHPMLGIDDGIKEVGFRQFREGAVIQLKQTAVDGIAVAIDSRGLKLLSAYTREKLRDGGTSYRFE